MIQVTDGYEQILPEGHPVQQKVVDLVTRVESFFREKGLTTKQISERVPCYDLPYPELTALLRRRMLVTNEDYVGIHGAKNSAHPDEVHYQVFVVKNPYDDESRVKELKTLDPLKSNFGFNKSKSLKVFRDTSHIVLNWDKGGFQSGFTTEDYRNPSKSTYWIKNTQPTA